MIILDTDVLIEIFDKESERGDKALGDILESGDSISTTAINLHEIMYGLRKYAKPVKEVLQLPVLNYTKEDANLSARIELEAEKVGSPMRRTDAMIAAIAINNRASLYTLDVKHFKPLELHGLKLFPLT
ncbi:MAG: type II toxin-antitoxin system VapC family toxin [Candidatus Bathyarchaeia archaeon]